MEQKLREASALVERACVLLDTIESPVAEMAAEAIRLQAELIDVIMTNEVEAA